MNDRGHSFLSGHARAEHGSITTWENEDGKTLTLHRSGPMRETLGETVREVLALDPTFRLVCYSTPESILTDLAGNRRDAADWQSGNALPIALPEVKALAMIGRRDLLHPRLNRGTERSGERQMAVEW